MKFSYYVMKSWSVPLNYDLQQKVSSFGHFNTIETNYRPPKLVAFELVRSVTSTRPTGAWALILQAINTLHRRGSGHTRL